VPVVGVESDPIWIADKPSYLTSATASATYAKLDGTNQPFTGNVTIGTTAAGANETINATLGAEMVTSPMVTGGWTLGFDTGGWSITAGVLSKTASTGTVTATAVSGMSAPTIGVTYKVTIVCSAVSGSPTYTLGGVSGSVITATTITDYITPTTTAKLIFSGSAAVTATITSVSVMPLTNATGDLTVIGNLKLGSPIQNTSGVDIITLGSSAIDVTGTTYSSGGFGVRTGNVYFRVGTTAYWQMTSAALYPLTNNAGDLGVTGTRMRTGYFGTSIIDPLLIGSTVADGTLTLEGNNAAAANTPTAANIIFKTGDSAGTTAMTILNNANK
jgi:hypothetical protein